MKPLCIDLCCGRGGWTKGFRAEGWRTVGYDIIHFPEYKFRFRRSDVFRLEKREIAEADFVVASTPCQEFSVFGMPHFHPNPPYPHLGIQLFCQVRHLLESAGVPYLMENVAAAQRFVGPAQHRAGSFFFWGNCIPPVFPVDDFTKGMSFCRLDGRYSRRAGVTHLRNMTRKRRASVAAEIPINLSRFVARYALYAIGKSAEPEAVHAD